MNIKDCEKNKIAKHCWEADHKSSWDQKKFVDKEIRLTSRKIQETVHLVYLFMLFQLCLSSVKQLKSYKTKDI